MNQDRTIGTSSQGATDAKQFILHLLRKQGVMTIDQLAEALQLSKTAARAHLTWLETDGSIARAPSPVEGPGRPPAAYTLTEQGSATFPTNEVALFARLLRFLDARQASDLVKSFFEDLWNERRVLFLQMLTEDAAGDLDHRLTVLVEMLTRQNFMPLVECAPNAGGGMRVKVTECNCPISAAARATRVPCTLESQFIGEAIGGRLVHSSFAQSRKENCVFEYVVGGTDESASPPKRR
jgi:predicted ArsR family transcriptional regulator